MIRFLDFMLKAIIFKKICLIIDEFENGRYKKCVSKKD